MLRYRALANIVGDKDKMKRKRGVHKKGKSRTSRHKNYTAHFILIDLNSLRTVLKKPETRGGIFELMNEFLHCSPLPGGSR